MTVDTCVKNMETLSLLQDLLPSGLLLQGGRGFSHSSSEKSSLEGVWIVRKEKKMKENERKTRACSTSLQKLLLIRKLKSKNFLVTKCSLGIIYHKKNYKLPN